MIVSDQQSDRSVQLPLCSIHMITTTTKLHSPKGGHFFCCDLDQDQDLDLDLDLDQDQDQDLDQDQDQDPLVLVLHSRDTFSHCRRNTLM